MHINDNQGQEQKHWTKKALIFKQEQRVTRLEKVSNAKDMIKSEQGDLDWDTKPL